MCEHHHTATYGRTDAVGDAIVEERCEDCGATVDIREARA